MGYPVKSPRGYLTRFARCPGPLGLDPRKQTPAYVPIILRGSIFPSVGPTPVGPGLRAIYPKAEPARHAPPHSSTLRPLPLTALRAYVLCGRVSGSGDPGRL